MWWQTWSQVQAHAVKALWRKWLPAAFSAQINTARHSTGPLLEKIASREMPYTESQPKIWCSSTYNICALIGRRGWIITSWSCSDLRQNSAHVDLKLTWIKDSASKVTSRNVFQMVYSPRGLTRRQPIRTLPSLNRALSWATGLAGSSTITCQTVRFQAWCMDFQDRAVMATKSTWTAASIWGNFTRRRFQRAATATPPATSSTLFISLQASPKPSMGYTEIAYSLMRLRKMYRDTVMTTSAWIPIDCITGRILSGKLTVKQITLLRTFRTLVMS